jgi:hypothetical protein
MKRLLRIGTPPFEYTNCPYDGTALSFLAGDPPEQAAPVRGGDAGGRGGRGRRGQ